MVWENRIREEGRNFPRDSKITLERDRSPHNAINKAAFIDKIRFGLWSIVMRQIEEIERAVTKIR